MAYGTVNVDAMTTSDGVTSAGTYGFKNRIINGAMVINQRGFSGTPANGDYTLDRWQANLTASSKYTLSQNAGSITPPAGFSNYLGITSSSAYSVGSGDQFNVLQKIEGYNIADLAWGTASASAITISFKVYSSLTGTFSGSLANSALNRCYVFNYTVSSANTWTTISVTIAGDTSGTWVTNNGTGMFVIFGLGSGSTYSGTAGSWGSTYYTQSTGSVSVVGTNGATFYITGVQLEKGSTATSFDYRPYGTELQLCQRYFEMTFPQGTAPVNGYTADLIQQGLGAWTSFSGGALRSPLISFKVTKRATPSITIYNSGNSSSGTFGFYNGGWSSTTLVTVYAQDWGLGFNVTAGSGTTAGSYLLAGAWTASSEL